MPLSDSLNFFRAWLRAPRSIGALAPSSSSLARMMTHRIHHADGPVIELGPGTGVFTRALLARGVPLDRLALIEADPVFARALSHRYPTARVLSMDAANLGNTLCLFGNERASAVVSGLPLLSMSTIQVSAILRGVFDRHLRADGSFYQFTYGPRCPLQKGLLQQQKLRASRIGGVWLNFPPAHVYRISRDQQDDLAA